MFQITACKKTRMRQILVLLKTFILLTIFTAQSDFKAQTENNSLKNKSNFILIKDAEMFQTQIFRPNAAVLLTEQDQIKQHEDLFLGNRTFAHACGFHYTIEFWENSDHLVDNFPFNQECEVFAKNNISIQLKMKEYIKLLETNPTHFIYNLKIPVAFEPELVKKSFENSDFTIVFLKGNSEHLSEITFSFMQVSQLKEMEDRNKWEDEQNQNKELAISKLKSIVEEINKVILVKEQSKITFPMQSFGQTIKHQAEITLKFPPGTDFKKVKKIIQRNGGEYNRESKPKYYYVQLVETSNDLKVIKEKMKKYSFVDTVFEYPNTK
jgi:hypothetical protein